MKAAARRILVVEDDRSVGKVVEVALRLEGHAVRIARSMQEGLSALRADHYDLVILDVNLPGGTGLELLRLLRRELVQTTPVIMLSGQKQEDSIVRALRWGADDYITKPFSPRELVARADRWMRDSDDVASVRR